MSILTITDDGLSAVKNARAGGFLINVTHFKVGSPSPGFPIFTSDRGSYSDPVNDGMTKDSEDNSCVKFSSEITRISPLQDSAVLFTLVVPSGIPNANEDPWSLTEIGLYLEDGTMFAHGEAIPAYPKQFEYGIEIRCVVVLTRLCDVINLIVGNDARLASTLVRRLERPSTSPTNAFVVLDQHNNYDQTTSPSIALQYGNGNDSWGYVGYTRVFTGNVECTTDSNTHSSISLNPAANGFWLLDKEPVIVQVRTVTGSPSSNGIGESRRMVFDAATNTFNEADGKQFSATTNVNISIWRDPAWMLSTYGQDSDIELHVRNFTAYAGDFSFDLSEPVDAGSTLVHVDGVLQVDSYYINSNHTLVFYDKFEVTAKVSVKWSVNVQGQGFGIKFKRSSLAGTGSSTYNIASGFQSTDSVNVSDSNPLFYVEHVQQTVVTYNESTKTANFNAAVLPSQAIESVFFERYPVHGTPVLKKFVFPGGKSTYKSPLPIADVDHVLVYVGQVYQTVNAFSIRNNGCSIVLNEPADIDQKVTLYVSSVLFGQRNVPLYEEFVALRDYVFCKLGRPDDRTFEVATTSSSTNTLHLVEPLDMDAPIPILVSANSVVQSSYAVNVLGTAISIDGLNLEAGKKLYAHQVLSRTFGRHMYTVEERRYASGLNQTTFELPKPCRNKANLIVLVNNVLQSSSFMVVGRSRYIEFSERLVIGTPVRILQLFNVSDVGGPFGCEDFKFISTGELVFDLNKELDSKDSVLVFAGQVPQLNFEIGLDRRSIVLDEPIPNGVAVNIKHLHQQCFSSTFSF